MTSPRWPALPSSVATCALGEELRAARVVGVAKAQQRLGIAEGLAPRDERDDPDAASDEQRAPARRRGLEAPAQRPEQPQAVAGAQLAQAPRARADVLQQELHPPRVVAQVGEGPRKERALVRPSPHRSRAASM